MDDVANELDLVVGSMITVRPDEDREEYEDEREFVQNIQDFLREEGVDVDLLSQPGTQVWEGGIRHFYDLHQLQRLAAHLEQGNDPSAVLGGASADGMHYDELLADIWDNEVQTRFPHLIKHQADGGYYLPAEFAEPIWIGEGDEDEDGELDDEGAIAFGSSVGLLRELTELEQLMDRAKIPMAGPRQALQALKTAAEQSVNYGLPVILW